MKIFIPILLVLVSLSSVRAQVYTRKYEVKSSDKRIGQVVVTRSLEGEIEQYTVDSDVTMSMIISLNVSYKVQATFKKGVLVASSATIYLNGNIQDQVDVERKGDHYEVVMNGHTTRIYQEITASSASLFFSKPKGIKTVFSETSGIMKPVTETADGKFKLRDPDKESNLNTYTYSSDQGLNGIEIERSLFPTLNLVYTREPRPAETE